MKSPDSRSLSSTHSSRPAACSCAMASTRLKRKLDQADEGQYGNLTESFVSVGTALPSLAEHKKDTNEFVPPWEQKVFDEQGRCVPAQPPRAPRPFDELTSTSSPQAAVPRRLHRWVLGGLPQQRRLERRCAASQPNPILCVGQS